MSFDWNEYISLAQELALSSDNAKLRSATSRAYYGVFCRCRNKKGYSGSRIPNIHQTVITEYKTSGNRTEFSIGNHLHDLREQRNKADYDGFYGPTKYETNSHITKAKSIVNLLQELEEED